MMPTPIPTMSARELRSWERRLRERRLFAMAENRKPVCTRCGGEALRDRVRCAEHRDGRAGW